MNLMKAVSWLQHCHVSVCHFFLSDLFPTKFAEPIFNLLLHLLVVGLSPYSFLGSHEVIHIHFLNLLLILIALKSLGLVFWIFRWWVNHIKVSIFIFLLLLEHRCTGGLRFTVALWHTNFEYGPQILDFQLFLWAQLAITSMILGFCEAHEALN